MISKYERFWIIFILRFAFGFLFLFAAINIFSLGPDKFSEEIGKGFATTWFGKRTVGPYSGLDFCKLFLKFAPYLMAGLSVLILTGILVRPALRIGALLLICFGLGKYMQLEIATTAADFLFAFIICVGLYFMGLHPRKAGDPG